MPEPVVTDEARLYKKLSEVIKEVSGVARDGRNDFHKYDYTTAEAILRAFRGPLAERSIVLMPSVEGIEERSYRTSKGAESTITTVRVTFTLVDGETGCMHKCQWAGQGDDPADKGLGKAYTNAIKTFLREQFLVPQGDDPEADPKTDERAQERAGAPEPPPVLTEKKRGDVVAAFKAAGIEGDDFDIYLAAAGVEDVTKMTADHARKLRTLLDKAQTPAAA